MTHNIAMKMDKTGMNKNKKVTLGAARRAVITGVLLTNLIAATTAPMARETGTQQAQPLQTKDTSAGKLVYGKYGCTATKNNGGTIEYVMRGSFVITKDGKYTYSGFKNPSRGTFAVDKSGNLWFKGGYFNGGKAEKIDRPNKFFLTFPTNPDNRWTCGLIEAR